MDDGKAKNSTPRGVSWVFYLPFQFPLNPPEQAENQQQVQYWIQNLNLGHTPTLKESDHSKHCPISAPQEASNLEPLHSSA